MGSLDTHLSDLLADLSAELPEVTKKRMFGCDGYFANDAVYALVWDARIVLKLPEPALAEAALAMESALPWKPMPNAKPMSHWVVMSEELHDDVDTLRPYLEAAHRLAMSAPKKVKKPRAKAAAPKAKVVAKKAALRQKPKRR
jgi:TfoX/Sxy family transcriptional regulator of competence genes